MRRINYLLLGILFSLLTVGYVDAKCTYPGATSDQYAEVLNNSSNIYYTSWSSYAGGVYNCDIGGGSDYYVSDPNRTMRQIQIDPAASCGPDSATMQRGRSRYIDVNDPVCYVLAPVEPETCSNGVKDGDETGIDCGGSCSAACEFSCPPGTEELLGPDGVTPGCFWYGLQDKYGNCPRGSVRATDLGYSDACYQEYGYVAAAAGITPDAITLPSFSKGSFSVTEVVYPSTIVDNGDGTSTKTTVTQKTDGNGNVTNITNSEVINNVTGATISSSTEEIGEISAEDNPENYDIAGPETPEYDANLESGEDYPEETDLDQLLDSFQNNSVVQAINGSGLQLSSASCSISATLFNRDVSISFCDSRIIEWLNVIGALLVSITYLSTPFMIFARG